MRRASGSDGFRFAFDDIRLAARRLRKHPGATVTSILALASGIAAAAIAWSLLSAVLLHPLADPDGS